MIAYLFFICLCAFLSEQVDVDDSKNAKILVYESDRKPNNGYFFKYETSDGIKREETGETVLSETGIEILRVKGFYSFVEPSGTLYNRRYIADDKGYREWEEDEAKTPNINLGLRIATPAISSLQGGGGLG